MEMNIEPAQIPEATLKEAHLVPCWNEAHKLNRISSGSFRLKMAKKW